MRAEAVRAMPLPPLTVKIDNVTERQALVLREVGNFSIQIAKELVRLRPSFTRDEVESTLGALWRALDQANFTADGYRGTA